MTNETLSVIKRRRSIRKYADRQVEEKMLEAVVEAGTFAPNASDQAWHFTVVQNKALLKRLNLAAKRYASASGLPWLEALGKDEAFDCLYGAPTVVLVSCDSRSVAPQVDTAAATENLLIAAESVGLGACWGYFATQAFLSDEGPVLRDAFQIPEGFGVYVSVMLGYKEGDAPEARERRQGVVTYIR